MATVHADAAYHALPGNKAIVIGGRTKSNPGFFNMASFSNTYEIYSGGSFGGEVVLPPVAGEDDSVAAGLKGGRSAMGSVSTKDKVVVVGGIFGNVVDAEINNPNTTTIVYRASILVYDIQSDTWNVSAVAMPYPVFFSKLYVLDQDNILIVGGINVNTWLPSAQTFIYCISNDTLTPSADLPTVYVPDFDAYLPYNAPDENAQGAIALNNGSFLNFLGIGTQEGFNPAGHSDTLTLDKKRGKSNGHRVFTNDEVLANKAKHFLRIKRMLKGNR
jgi:hypothetical protein